MLVGRCAYARAHPVLLLAASTRRSMRVALRPVADDDEPPVAADDCPAAAAELCVNLEVIIALGGVVCAIVATTTDAWHVLYGQNVPPPRCAALLGSGGQSYLQVVGKAYADVGWLGVLRVTACLLPGQTPPLLRHKLLTMSPTRRPPRARSRQQRCTAAR